MSNKETKVCRDAQSPSVTFQRGAEEAERTLAIDNRKAFNSARQDNTRYSLSV